MKPNSTFVLIKRRSPLAAPPPPQGHPGQAKTLRNAAPAHSPAAVTCLLSHCWIPAALWSRNISPVHGASPAAKANTPLTGQHTPFVKQTHGHIDFVCVQKKKNKLPANCQGRVCQLCRNQTGCAGLGGSADPKAKAADFRGGLSLERAREKGRGRTG